MKTFSSPAKNTIYLFYRLISPVIDPLTMATGVIGYSRFAKEIWQYKQKDPSAVISAGNLYPVFSDRLSFTPFDAQYFFQGRWLLDQLLKRKPIRHVDVGSKYELSGYISLFTKAEFVDLRPIQTHVDNLKIVKADILHLPYNDNSVPSLSSLHVVEHIGLGRYGDEINPEGTVQACNELQRVLKRGGYLYLSLPIGKHRICFNAHRIHNPEEVRQFFGHLKLVDFSVVDDNGKFITHAKMSDYEEQQYACGMYIFQKTKY